MPSWASPSLAAVSPSLRWRTESENLYNSSILRQRKVCRKKFHTLRGSSNSSEVGLPGAWRRVGSRRPLMLSPSVRNYHLSFTWTRVINGFPKFMGLKCIRSRTWTFVWRILKSKVYLHPGCTCFVSGTFFQHPLVLSLVCQWVKHWWQEAIVLGTQKNSPALDGETWDPKLWRSGMIRSERADPEPEDISKAGLWRHLFCNHG